jgi:hypothetical protein
MKTQKVETTLNNENTNLENTNLNKRRKWRKLAKKVTESFRNFLENSE